MVSHDSCLLGDLIGECGAFSQNTSVRIDTYSSDFDGSMPMVSFIIPVHNQERVIAANLASIEMNSSASHEYVVIVDGCTDETEDQVRSWASKVVAHNSSLRVTVVVIDEDVFETMSDSIGARLASGTYLVEIQADMNFYEYGFDDVLLHALQEVPEVVAVGGRGAHSFRLLNSEARRSPADFVGRVTREALGAFASVRGRYRPTRLEQRFSDSIGRTGDLIERPLDDVSGDRWLFTHETVMRGPLAVRRSDFIGLDGFDTSNFFLGNDDHDFAMRALVEAGRRVGYLPIGFESPLAQGSTRAIQAPEAKARLGELKKYYAARFSSSALARHLPSYTPPARYATRIGRNLDR